MLLTQITPWIQPLQSVAIGLIAPYLSRILTTPSTPKLIKYLLLVVFCVIMGLVDAVIADPSVTPETISKRIFPVLVTAFTVVHKLEEAGGLNAWDAKTTQGFTSLRNAFMKTLKAGQSDDTKDADVKMSPLTTVAAKELRLRTLFEQKRITRPEYEAQLTKLVTERQSALDAELEELT